MFPRTAVVLLGVTSLAVVAALGALWLAGGLDRLRDPSIGRDLLAADPVSPLQRTNPDPLNNVYFGDLHIHTSYSSDAWLMGVRTLPADAYRYARGVPIPHAAGYRIQISRPLDFAAVTDHAEYLAMARAVAPDVPLKTQTLPAILQGKNRLAITLDWLRTTLRIARHGFDPFVIDDQASSSAWQSIIEVAERYNQPDVFTTFIAYEWSSQPAGANLHRNVIFRGGPGQVPDRPFSALDSENPEDLLRQLALWNAAGLRGLAIPHNANLSTGRMYGRLDFAGQPMSAEYKRLRSEFEPVHEILQVKGASETHPVLSNLDEFADFEIFESNMAASGASGTPAGSYARDALRTGLEMAHDEGFNPYKFGVIGASDGHNSSSPIEESRYHGKLPIMDGTASLRLNTALLLPDSQARPLRWGSGGLAGIWARQNTRGALFAAMQRRETYATSGTRIKLRFFASWDFDLGPAARPDLSAPDVTAAAYARGVAMGGELVAPAAAAPQFLVWAYKDPDGANLDRIQIVKLWLDESGGSQEKIFDVAYGADRKRRPDGRLIPVGNTVDLDKPGYTNAIGEPYLQAVWRDPEFDATAWAAYYARAIEIPTPRWSTYDAAVLGTEPIAPAVIQERAISSSIWYQP